MNPVQLPPDVALVAGTEGFFFVPTKDNAISRQIIETGGWAVHDLPLFRKLIPAGGNVLDIGANVGHHTVVFSKVAAKVYAFEPQQRVYHFLSANLALNSCHNVHAFQMALSDEPGFERMLPMNYDGNNWGALGMSKLPSFQTGEIVEVTTVDEVLERWPMPVHFMKVDVQTFELYVLRGAKKLLEREHPVIFVEVYRIGCTRAATACLTRT